MFSTEFYSCYFLLVILNFSQQNFTAVVTYCFISILSVVQFLIYLKVQQPLGKKAGRTHTEISSQQLFHKKSKLVHMSQYRYQVSTNLPCYCMLFFDGAAKNNTRQYFITPAIMQGQQPHLHYCLPYMLEQQIPRKHTD